MNFPSLSLSILDAVHLLFQWITDFEPRNGRRWNTLDVAFEFSRLATLGKAALWRP